MFDTNKIIEKKIEQRISYIIDCFYRTRATFYEHLRTYSLGFQHMKFGSQHDNITIDGAKPKVFLMVGLGQPPLRLDHSSQNPNFFNFYSLGQKNLIGSGKKIPGSKAGQPLIYCGSKLCSGRVRVHH